MESVTDLERARPADQTGGRMPDLGSRSAAATASGMPESALAMLTQAANEETA